jgi:hypothetical protein
MHKTNRRKVIRQRKERNELINSFTRSMPLAAAERAAKAVRRGLDLWAWQQGRVQFLTPGQIDLAMAHGLEQWVISAVNGADSADPFFTIRGSWSTVLRYYPEAFAVHTRCAGRRGDHSLWAYGPVFLTKQAAREAGYTHQIECGCGRIDYLL